MLIQEVIALLEDLAPLSLQESYDNAGLLTGNKQWEVHGVLCTLDVVEATIDEAIELKVNLIITHHPFIFGHVKSITGRNATERILIKAIKHDIAIYAAHTNLDSISQGVNRVICDKLGLEKVRILDPVKDSLNKLVTFAPKKEAQQVREAILTNGGGHIGNYDYCSYNLEGTGTFRGGEQSNPFVGKAGEIHEEAEVRIETIVPNHLLSKCLKAMLQAHPYEEVAYDVYPLKNKLNTIGAGMIGELPKAMDAGDFLKLIQNTFNIPAIRYSGKSNAPILRVALCGGSGSFLLKQALSQRADAFLTGDVKYHQFFDAEDQLLYCDIGHYESEQFTKDLFYSLLTKKISTFAVHLTSIVTNPIKYYV